jgi:drug/metabolite transporter (DMT)-like permease
MSSGLVLGLVAAVCWGLTDVAAALGGRRFGSLLTLAIAQATSIVVLIVVALVLEGGIPDLTAALPPAVAMGALAVIGYVAFFASLRIGPLSVVSPTVAAYGGLTVILAVVLLGELIRPVQWAGAALATVGIVLAGVHFDGSIRHARLVSRGVLLAVVALIGFSFLIVGSAGPIRQVGWLPFTLVERVTNAALVWALFVVMRVARPRGSDTLLDHPDPPSRFGLVLAVAAGLVDVAGLVAFNIGLEVSFAWLVGLASSFAPAVAVLVAVLVLGERPRPIQWFGLIAIGAGLVLVAAPA